MIAVVLIVIFWGVIVCHCNNQDDTDGSLSMEDREAFVLKNVVVKKALKMQNNPKIAGLSTQTDSDPPGDDIEERQDSYYCKKPEKMNKNDRPSEACKKDDILVDSLHEELRSAHHNILDDDNSNSSSMYSPKHCAICIQKYKDGDDICWSRNDKCHHVYHLNCMVEWLMRHDDCPMCRQLFLQSTTSRDENCGECPN